MKDAARTLRSQLEEYLVPKQPKWSVRSTPRGLGVEVREGERPIALVWWDRDGWWCRRFPGRDAPGVEPIHEMDDWTIESMTQWIIENDPARPK